MGNLHAWISCAATLATSACLGDTSPPRPECVNATTAATFATPVGAVAAPYAVQGDHAFVGGDMAFRIAQHQYLAAGLRGGRLWTGGVVPYDIPAAFGGDRPRVEKAIANWNAVSAQTGLRWVRRTTEADYVRFQDDDPGCYAALGQQGGAQPVNLRASCPEESYDHELGHSIGLMHEHQRPDRDQFVTVNVNALGPELRSALVVLREVTPLGAYDIRSVMHYRSGPPDNPYMTAKDSSVQPSEIGARGIKTSDIAGVARLYGGPGPSAAPAPSPAPEPTRPSPVPTPPSPPAPPPPAGSGTGPSACSFW